MHPSSGKGISQYLYSLIQTHGPISLAEYMEICALHPLYGYYMSRDPFGAGGDFITSPEISQMFGELLGLWALTVWEKMGAPHPFHLVECGPGRGTLMADALRATKICPAFHKAVCVHFIEMSPILKKIQARTLSAYSLSFSWHENCSTLPPGPSIFLANEFFDAFPIDHYRYSRQQWTQCFIRLKEEDQNKNTEEIKGKETSSSASSGRFEFIWKSLPSLSFPEAAFNELIAHAPPETCVEINVSAYRYVQTLGKHLLKYGGAALIIDYGHMLPPYFSTLQAVKAHSSVDVLDIPQKLYAEGDISSHVHFPSFLDAAQNLGMLTYGPFLQRDFLLYLGLESRAQRLKQSCLPPMRYTIDQAVERLVGGHPEAQGILFKILGLASPLIDLADLFPLPSYALQPLPRPSKPST